MSNACKGVGGTIDSTVQGVKDTTGKVADASVISAKTLGDALVSTARSLKQAAEKITPRKEPRK